MLPPPTPSTPPGWYDDPWRTSGLRWFDGATWTGHVAGGSPAVSPQAASEAIAAERKAGRWLRLVLALYPVVWIGVAAVTRSASRSYFRAVRDSLDQINAGAPYKPVVGSPGLYLASPLALALVGVQIWWAVMATRSARAVGLTTRRDPGLAGAAFIIPIVNLWWPTQTMRDLFPQSAQADLPIASWWTAQLLGSLVAGTLVFASLLVRGTAVLVLLLGGLALIALWCYLLIGFVNRSLSTHESLASQ
jgi:hypothetical protein